MQAAISFINTVKEVDSKRIGLVGYSTGAGFAFPVFFNDARIKALVAVSPPLSMFNSDLLRYCPRPKLLVLGSRDDLIPTNQFFEFCQNLPEPKECKIVEGANHFLWGYESRLAAKEAAFFTKILWSSA